MKTQFILLITFTLMVTSSFSQSADEAIRIRQNEVGFGARNLAMGGNGVVLSEDYSAIYWNPAGLASLKHSEFMGELSHLRFSNEAVFANSYSDMNESFTHFRTAGLAFSLPTTQGSLVLALGYNFVADYDDYLYFTGFNKLSNGLEFELEDENGIYNWYSFDRDVNQTEEVISRGGLHQWSLAGAIALSPSFDFGATMNFWSGREEYNLMFQQEDTENIYTVYPADFDNYIMNHSMITDFKAFSLKLGSMMKINRTLRLGFAMEFPTTFNIIENYDSNDELTFDDGYIDAVTFEPSEWEYKIKTPYRFDAGIGIKYSNLNLTASLTYQDWTQTRYEKPEAISMNPEYSELLSENRIIQKEFRETLNYHLGGEIIVPNSNLFLRGGYAVYPSPLKEATPDMAKKVYSAGIGFKIGENTHLDFTYLTTALDRESEDIYTPGGTLEQVTRNQLFLGLRFQF